MESLALQKLTNVVFKKFMTGLTLNEIASFFEIKVKQVLSLISKRSGISKKEVVIIAKLIEEGATHQEITTSIDISEDVLNVNFPTFILTKEKRRQIEQMNLDGKTNGEISEVVSVIEDVIVRVLLTMKSASKPKSNFDGQSMISTEVAFVPISSPKFDELITGTQSETKSEANKHAKKSAKLLELQQINEEPPQENEEIKEVVEPPPRPYIYYIKVGSSKLFQHHLVTGTENCLRIPKFYFKKSCAWCQIDNENLVVSGGCDVDFTLLREIVVINTSTLEFFDLGPMFHSRQSHLQFYYKELIYFLGGVGYLFGNSINGSSSKTFESISLQKIQRQLKCPKSFEYASAILQESTDSLYVIESSIDKNELLKLNIYSFNTSTWRESKLWYPNFRSVALFKVEQHKLYLLDDKRIYSLNTYSEKLKIIKRVHGFNCEPHFETTFYHGKLYTASFMKLSTITIGALKKADRILEPKKPKSFNCCLVA